MSKKRMRPMLLIGLACLSLVAPSFGQAALVTWVLQGVMLQETQGSSNPGNVFSATGSYL